MSQLVFVLLSIIFLGASTQYKVPKPKFKIFEPKGFEVSIPATEGVTLFSFHAKLNEEFDGLEPGRWAKDIKKPKNGSYIFKDNTTSLCLGDAIYYWIYVKYKKLDYTNDDDGVYIVKKHTHKLGTNKTSKGTTAGPKVTASKADETSQGTTADPLVTTPKGDETSQGTTAGSTVTASKADETSKGTTAGPPFTAPPADETSQGTTAGSTVTAPEADETSEGTTAFSTVTAPEADETSQGTTADPLVTTPKGDETSQGTTAGSTVAAPEADETSQDTTAGSKVTAPEADETSQGTTAGSTVTAPEADETSQGTTAGSTVTTPKADEASNGTTAGLPVTTPEADETSKGTTAGPPVTTPKADEASKGTTAGPPVITPEADDTSQGTTAGSTVTAPKDDETSKGTTAGPPVTAPEADETSKGTTAGPPVTPPKPDETSKDSNCQSSVTLINNGAPIRCAGQIIFDENFNGNKLNDSRWLMEKRFEGPPDHEFVLYEPNDKVLNVENGTVSIKPLATSEIYEHTIGKLELTPCTGRLNTTDCEREGTKKRILPPFVSAQFSTKNSFDFKYGKVVIKAKVPNAPWVFPQLFLEPVTPSYGASFYQSGQMRVAFTRSSGGQSANELFGGVILNANETFRYEKLCRKPGNDVDWSADYHEYSLEWRPTKITVSVDNEVYCNLEPESGGFADMNVNGEELPNKEILKTGSLIAPFDQQFYIKLGYGIGGQHDFSDVDTKPWVNKKDKGMKVFWKTMKRKWRQWLGTNSTLMIDYVRVYSV